MRRSLQAFGVAAFAVCSALPAAGCSDDTTATNETTTSTVAEDPPSPVSTLDHVAYLQRLDEVCTSPELGGAVGAPVAASSTVDEIDAQVDALTDRLDLMREPEIPSGDEDAFDTVEQAYDRLLTTLSELTVETGDTAVAEDLATDFDGLRDAVNDAVAAAGVDACSV